METPDLLIADSSMEFILTLQNTLQGFYRIRFCTSGTDAFRILKADRPDLLLLDLMLPGLDGISLLHRAAAEGCCPTVLATAPYISNYMREAAERLSVSYIMVKPCDFRAIRDRLQDLSRQIHLPPGTAANPDVQISNMLLSLGLSSKHRGYAYLCDAIRLCAENQFLSATKELYPAVAQLHGVTPAQVERSIRTAINSAYRRLDFSVWSRFFPPCSDGTIPHVTNFVFITQLSEKLRLDQMTFPLP